MTNKTAQFTPGPWYPHLAKADHCLSSSVWGPEPGNQVAVIGGKSLQTMNANANLIAAAPAMYGALLQVREMLLILADNAGDVPEWNTGGEMCELAHIVRTALAQAEGQHHEYQGTIYAGAVAHK